MCFGQFPDYRSYVVRGSVRDNPALERSVMMCNGVSQWVQLMILTRHTAQQRAQVFTKFIHVAQVGHKRVICNFLLLRVICAIIAPLISDGFNTFVVTIGYFGKALYINKKIVQQNGKTSSSSWLAI